jgi:hypothetical protein
VNNTSFHPPVSLSDARERRARRQRPYPAVVADTEFRAPLQAHVPAANDQAEMKRVDRRARFLVLLPLAPLLVALGLHLYFR